MSDPRNAALEYTQENKARFLNDLIEFSTIPSVSTDPERAGDMQKTAKWVEEHLDLFDTEAYIT